MEGSEDQDLLALLAAGTGSEPQPDATLSPPRCAPPPQRSATSSPHPTADPAVAQPSKLAAGNDSRTEFPPRLLDAAAASTQAAGATPHVLRCQGIDPPVCAPPAKDAPGPLSDIYPVPPPEAGIGADQGASAVQRPLKPLSGASDCSTQWNTLNPPCDPIPAAAAVAAAGAEVVAAAAQKNNALVEDHATSAAGESPERRPARGRSDSQPQVTPDPAQGGSYTDATPGKRPTAEDEVDSQPQATPPWTPAQKVPVGALLERVRAAFARESDEEMPLWLEPRLASFPDCLLEPYSKGSAALDLQGSSGVLGEAVTAAVAAAADGTPAPVHLRGQLDQEQLSIIIHCTLWGGMSVHLLDLSNNPRNSGNGHMQISVRNMVGSLKLYGMRQAGQRAGCALHHLLMSHCDLVPGVLSAVSWPGGDGFMLSRLTRDLRSLDVSNNTSLCSPRGPSEEDPLEECGIITRILEHCHELEVLSLQHTGMTNKGIETLSRLLAAKASRKLRVVKMGPPTDNGGDLQNPVVQGSLIALLCPLLHQPQRLEALYVWGATAVQQDSMVDALRSSGAGQSNYQYVADGSLRISASAGAAASSAEHLPRSHILPPRLPPSWAEGAQQQHRTHQGMKVGKESVARELSKLTFAKRKVPRKAVVKVDTDRPRGRAAPNVEGKRELAASPQAARGLGGTAKRPRVAMTARKAAYTTPDHDSPSQADSGSGGERYVVGLSQAASSSAEDDDEGASNDDDEGDDDARFVAADDEENLQAGVENEVYDPSTQDFSELDNLKSWPNDPHKEKHAPKGLFGDVIGRRRNSQIAHRKCEAAARLQSQAAARRVKQTPTAAPSRSSGGPSADDHSGGGSYGVAVGEALPTPIVISDTESEGDRAKERRKAKHSRGGRSVAAALRQFTDTGAKESRMGREDMLQQEKQQRAEASETDDDSQDGAASQSELSGKTSAGHTERSSGDVQVAGPAEVGHRAPAVIRSGDATPLPAIDPSEQLGESEEVLISGGGVTGSLTRRALKRAANYAVHRIDSSSDSDSGGARQQPNAQPTAKRRNAVLTPAHRKSSSLEWQGVEGAAPPAGTVVEGQLRPAVTGTLPPVLESAAGACEGGSRGDAATGSPLLPADASDDEDQPLNRVLHLSPFIHLQHHTSERGARRKRRKVVEGHTGTSGVDSRSATDPLGVCPSLPVAMKPPVSIDAATTNSGSVTQFDSEEEEERSAAASEEAAAASEAAAAAKEADRLEKQRKLERKGVSRESRVLQIAWPSDKQRGKYAGDVENMCFGILDYKRSRKETARFAPTADPKTELAKPLAESVRPTRAVEGAACRKIQGSGAAAKPPLAPRRTAAPVTARVPQAQEDSDDDIPFAAVLAKRGQGAGHATAQATGVPPLVMPAGTTGKVQSSLAVPRSAAVYAGAAASGRPLATLPAPLSNLQLPAAFTEARAALERRILAGGGTPGAVRVSAALHELQPGGGHALGFGAEDACTGGKRAVPAVTEHAERSLQGSSPERYPTAAGKSSSSTRAVTAAIPDVSTATGGGGPIVLQSIPVPLTAVADTLLESSCATRTAAVQAATSASIGHVPPHVPAQAGLQGQAVRDAPPSNAADIAHPAKRLELPGSLFRAGAAALEQAAQSAVGSVPEAIAHMALQSPLDGAVGLERSRGVPVAAIMGSYILPDSEEEV